MQGTHVFCSNTLTGSHCKIQLPRCHMKDKCNYFCDDTDFMFNLATLPWREMFAGKFWTAAPTQSLQQWTFLSHLFQAWLLWNWDLQAPVPSNGRPAAPCGSFQHWSPFQHAAAQNWYEETDGLSFECGEISPLGGRWGFSPSSCFFSGKWDELIRS